MKILKNLFSNFVFRELFVVFLFSLVVLNWVKPDEIIDSNDTIYPLRPIPFFQERLYQWKHTISTGVDFSYGSAGLTWHGIQALIAKTGVSIYTNQKIFLLLWFNLISFSFYFLILTLLPEKRLRLARLTGTVFYCFNPYLFNLWGNIQSANLGVYFFLPFASACLIQALKPKCSWFFWTIILGLGSVFSSSMGMNPQILFSLLINFFLLLMFLVYERVIRNKTISFVRFAKVITFSMVSFFLINIYWIIPDLRAIIGEGLSMQIPDANQLRGWLGVLSLNTSVLNVFRIQGEWIWYFSNRGEPYVPFSQIFQTNSFLIGLSFLPIFLSFVTLSKSKNRFAALFGLILFFGIFISIGIKPPFGYLYQFLTEKIKFFSFFRSPWYKFTSLTVLGYAVLISLFLEWLISLKHKKISFILGILIIVGELIYAYPLLINEVFPVSFKFLPPYRFSIPDYIWQAGAWLDGDKEEAKIVVLPRQGDRDCYYWGYCGSLQILNLLPQQKPVLNDDSWTVIDDMGGYRTTSSFYRHLFQSDTKEAVRILAPFNVKYLVQKNDFYYDFTNPVGSPEFIAQKLSEQKFIKKKAQFGDWDIYEIEQTLRYPFIYPVKALSIFEGNSAIMSEAFLLNKEPGIGFIDRNTYQSFSNKFAQNYLINDLTAGELLQKKPISWKTNVFVRFLPGDLFYPYIRSKEEKLLSSTTNSFEKLKLYILFANKRLKELEKMKDNNGIIAKNYVIIQKLVDDYSANLDNYENNMFSLKDVLDKNKTDWLQETEIDLASQKEKLIRIYEYTSKIDFNFKEVLLNLINKVIDLQKKTALILESDVSSPEIKKFRVKLETRGNYQVMVLIDGSLPDKTWQESSFEMVNNGVKYQPKVKLLENGWINLGSFDFSDRESRFNLKINSQEVKIPAFTEKDWIKSKGVIVAKKNGDNILSYDSNLTPVSSSLEIQGLDPGRAYFLSFEYKTVGFDFPKLIVSSKSDQKNIDGTINYKIDERLGYFPEWQKVGYILESENLIGPTTIKILLDKPNFPSEKGVMEIKNFRVFPLLAPTLMLKKEDTLPTESQVKLQNLPDIEFTKVNPTKYFINVKNAQDIFLLAFSETYNPLWKASINNTFLSENSHFEINGFANAWMVEKKGDFKIILEYYPQRDYEKMLLISGISVLAACFYIAVFTLRRENK